MYIYICMYIYIYVCVCVCVCICIFFNSDSLHARLNSHYKAWAYKRRSTKKITGYRKICLERTYSSKMSVNSRLKMPVNSSH